MTRLQRSLIHAAHRAASRLRTAILPAVAFAFLSAHAAEAQVWIGNPNRRPDLWVWLPQHESIIGTPPGFSPAISDGYDIVFNIPIASGVHENFGVKLIAPRSEDQMQNGAWPSTLTNQQVAQLYFQAHPEADFVFIYPSNALISDCDGNGTAMLGPGNPPCWGAPTATCERLDNLGNLLRSGRGNGGTCAPAPRFKIRVSAPPLINRGAVGVRVLGKNACLWLGMTAYSTENVPASGHAYVHFWEKMGGGTPQNPLPGRHETWGKYPVVPENQAVRWYWPFAPAEIKHDLPGFGIHTAWYPVTIAEHNAAMAVVDAARNNPNEQWSIVGQSCIDFAIRVMSAAGCPLPSSSSTADGVNSPLQFNRSCRRIVDEQQGVLGRCGFIVTAPHPQNGADNGLYDGHIVAERMVAAPQALAAELEFEFVAGDLGATALRTGSALTLSIARPGQSFALVDFGDGTVVRHDAAALSHTYAKPGQYGVRVLVFQNDRVAVRSLAVSVNAKAPRGSSVGCSIPDVDPISFRPPTNPGGPIVWQRTFPGDVNADWIVDGVDLAIVLADWGSAASSIADLDGDGIVGGSDLAIVLGAWGPPNE
jgi:hypothetical protein